MAALSEIADVPLNVVIPLEVQNHPGFGAQVIHASGLLPVVLGGALDTVSAEWGFKNDAKQAGSVWLKLSDGVMSDSAEFKTEDFQNENHIYRRLYSLWGQLLEERSHRLLKSAQDSLHRAITTPAPWEPGGEP